MLICIKCGKIIANCGSRVHYACCSSCKVSELSDAEKAMIENSNKTD